MIKFLKIFNLSILLFLAISCSTPSYVNLVSRSDLRINEQQDHEKCLMEKTVLAEAAKAPAADYLDCRYKLAKAREINLKIKTTTFNEEPKIADSGKDPKDSYDNPEHVNCLNQGYNLTNGSDAEIEAYYQCREAIALERLAINIKMTKDYQTSFWPNKSFYPQIIKDQQALKQAQIESVKNIFPLCSHLEASKPEFSQCLNAQKEARQCLSSIKAEKYKKDIGDKVYCQQQSFIQFPDDYELVKDLSREEIKKNKEKERLKLEKQRRAEEDKVKASLTIDFLKGNVDEIKNSWINKEEKLTPKEANKILQGKIELTRLRDQYVNKCNKSMAIKLRSFTEEVADNCIKTAINWDKQ